MFQSKTRPSLLIIKWCLFVAGSNFITKSTKNVLNTSTFSAVVSILLFLKIHCTRNFLLRQAACILQKPLHEQPMFYLLIYVYFLCYMFMFYVTRGLALLWQWPCYIYVVTWIFVKSFFWIHQQNPLEQGCPTGVPRTICGPRPKYMWPSNA